MRDDLRARIARWRAEPGGERREIRPEPRYDVVFWEGLAWLDSFAAGACEQCPDPSTCGGCVPDLDEDAP